MDQVLIVSDMLCDFVLPGGSLYTPGAETIIPAVAQELAEARRAGHVIIFSCDSHDSDDPEFARFPPHAVAGTPGAQIVPELAPRPGEHIVAKKTFDLFHDTTAGAIVRASGARSATVVGVCTHICVMEAVAGLYYRGLSSRVPLACVADFDPEAAQAALRRMVSVFGARLV